MTQVVDEGSNGCHRLQWGRNILTSSVLIPDFAFRDIRMPPRVAHENR